MAGEDRKRGRKQAIAHPPPPPPPTPKKKRLKE